MHDFQYRGNELYCEKVRVRDIAQKTGTPVYVYSAKIFTDHLTKIRKAFAPVRPLVCYSVKASSNLAILKMAVGRGAGLDIVSGGELYRARLAGCPGQKIVFAGVGKTDAEIAAAIRYGILLFNVESAPELERIGAVAARMKKKVEVSLRINPEVDPQTHRHIATGKAESKFGMDPDAAEPLFASGARFPWLSVCGIHVHIGSQIVTGDPFVRAFKKVLAFIDRLEARKIRIRYLNLGGGLGAIYNDENPQTAAEYAARILPLFRGRRFRFIFEPGRFVAANAGILVTRLLDVKKTRVKNFAIVDGAMNDLIRPALYGAHHQIWPLEKDLSRAVRRYDVVGPVCESGDCFAHARPIQELERGDYVAVMTAGAYGFSMASNYNSRPRAPEVLVKGNRFEVIRKRETCRQLVRGESIPSFI